MSKIAQWFEQMKMDIIRFIKYDVIGLQIPKYEDLLNVEKKTTLVDLSYLNINRDLNEAEQKRLKELEKELSESDLASFILYGKEMGDSLSDKQRLVMDYMAENQEIFKMIKEDTSTENLLRTRLDLDTKLNKLKTVSTLLEIEKQKRECELRIIALENKFKELERRASHKGIVRFFGEDLNNTRRKLDSINESLLRMTAQINTANGVLLYTTRIIGTVNNFEKSLDLQISHRDAEENERITRKILKELFEEAGKNLKTLKGITKDKNVPNPKSYDKELSIQDLANILAKEQKFLDEYRVSNKEELNQILEKTRKEFEKIKLDVEFNYDIPLWRKAKLNTETYASLFGRVRNVQNIYELLDDKIREDEFEELYKMEYYLYSIFFDITDKDESKFIYYKKISKKQKEYFEKIAEDIRTKIIETTKNRKLKAFLNQNYVVEKLKNFDIYNKDSLYFYFKILSRLDRWDIDGLVNFKVLNPARGNLIASSDEWGMPKDEDGKVLQEIQNISENEIVKKYANSLLYDEKYGFSAVFDLYPDSFEIETEAIINQKVRKENTKNNPNKKWNKNYIYFIDNSKLQISNYARSFTFDEVPRLVRIHISSVIAQYANAIRVLTNNKISKEFVRDKILSYESLKFEGKGLGNSSKTEVYIDENGNLKTNITIVYPKEHPEMAIGEMIEQFTESLLYSADKEIGEDGKEKIVIHHGLDDLEFFNSDLPSDAKKYIVEEVSKWMNIKIYEDKDDPDNIHKPGYIGGLLIANEEGKADLGDFLEDPHQFSVNLSSILKIAIKTYNPDLARMLHNSYDYIMGMEDAKTIFKMMEKREEQEK